MATKRLNGEGSIRKRKNGSWEARITVGIDAETSRQIRKSFYGKTRGEVKVKLEAFLDQQDDNQVSPELTPPRPIPKGSVTGPYASPQDANDLTLNEWLDIWENEYLADVKPSTVSNYKSLLDNHIRPKLGSFHLSMLKAPVIQKFYNELGKKGLSPKYIKNIHGVLHKAIEQAVLVEYTAKNYTSICKLPKVVEKEVVPLNEEEQERLFAALKGEEFEDLILVDIFTGLRCGELIGLTWDCIDFENGIIHVKKQLAPPRKKGGGGKCYWGTLKNNKTRDVYPAQFVMDVLKHHKAVQAAQKLAAGSLWDEGDFPGLVFTHPNGYHYIQPTIWKEFQKILKKAGLAHHRVHDLRHTFAVNSLKAGDDVKTLQENMGHFSAAFTLDRYGHVTKEMKKASSERMQKLIDRMSI